MNKCLFIGGQKVYEACIYNDMLMKSNVNFIAETGPHKPLVAVANAAAAGFYIRGPQLECWHPGQK